MELNGFRLPKDLPSYPSGELYCEYLNSFTKYFELDKHIRVSIFILFKDGLIMVLTDNISYTQIVPK